MSCAASRSSIWAQSHITNLCPSSAIKHCLNSLSLGTCCMFIENVVLDSFFVTFEAPLDVNLPELAPT